MQNDSKNRYLILGLGNPGEEYIYTRHNIGYRVVEAFARERDWPFQKKRLKKALLAKGKEGDREMILLKPLTYMNLSGEALKKYLKEDPIPKERILTVVDDADLPFGQVRLRQKGSSGGHNGLKSIEHTLQSREYCRIKMGIGKDPFLSLEDYVLKAFTKEQEEMLPNMIEKALRLIEMWVEKGPVFAMNQGNQKEEVGEQKE